jgi:hypothetical protein
MATLELYRQLIPNHAVVIDDVITPWLTAGIKALSSETFGTLWPEAVVLWAAHNVQESPGSGAPGAPSAGQAGPLISQRDGDLSRTYAQPQSGSQGLDPQAEEMMRTSYGRRFLALRNQLVAVTPNFYGPGLY